MATCRRLLWVGGLWSPAVQRPKPNPTLVSSFVSLSWDGREEGDPAAGGGDRSGLLFRHDYGSPRPEVHGRPAGGLLCSALAAGFRLTPTPDPPAAELPALPSCSAARCDHCEEATAEVSADERDLLWSRQWFLLVSIKYLFLCTPGRGRRKLLGPSETLPCRIMMH